MAALQPVEPVSLFRDKLLVEHRSISIPWHRPAATPGRRGRSCQRGCYPDSSYHRFALCGRRPGTIGRPLLFGRAGLVTGLLTCNSCIARKGRWSVCRSICHRPNTGQLSGPITLCTAVHYRPADIGAGQKRVRHCTSPFASLFDRRNAALPCSAERPCRGQHL